MFTGKLLDTVAEATGVSRSTVGRIIKEGHSVQAGEEIASLHKKVPIPRPSPKSSVDNCGEEVIRRTIYNFHITENIRPTIKTIYNKIKDDEGIGFTGKQTSFRKLLLNMGFRFVLLFVFYPHYFICFIHRWKKPLITAKF